MDTYKILIVEDEELLAKKMKSFLESWGYEVEIVRDFSNVLQEFHSVSPDLVLMDINLPGVNGFEWTRQIRKESKVPIIFISSHSESMNIIMALSQGGDDFITKPFDLQILAAKILALLRRSYDFNKDSETIEYNGVIYRLSDNTLTYQNQSVELTKNEGKILYQLLSQHGRIVSRGDIMEALWQTDYYIDENTLSVNVNRLRKKLSSIGLEDFIQTKKGMGYKI